MCVTVYLPWRFDSFPQSQLNTSMMTERTKEEILEQINQIVDDYIQPSVQQHGGWIKVEDFDTESGRVLVLLQGSCSGCSSSTITLKMGVENMLVHYVLL
jgi:Fe-S cluster biogenesis protein NfuA